jgi:hypothetical protein
VEVFGLGMADDLNDDELLNVPLGNLRPGELARAFVIEAQHIRKVEEVETERFVSVLAQRHDEQEKEAEQQEVELQERESRLIAQINIREDELREEAERQDARAIKLADGRRAYVDGDKYRDENGRVLAGADRAQAEIDHIDHPDATTWQEHQELAKQWSETEKLKAKVEGLQNGSSGADADKTLSSYEKEFQAQTAKTSQVRSAADYASSNDYMADLGLTSTFKAANIAGGAIAPPAPVQAQPSALPKASALSL